MKRVILAAIILSAVSFSSCRKCITCSITNQTGNLAGSKEFCGSKKERSERESDYFAQCDSLRAINPETDCECAINE